MMSTLVHTSTAQRKPRKAAARALHEPASEPAAAWPYGSITALQKTAGNRAVGRLLHPLGTSRIRLQAKVARGQPGDAYEREADQVAEAVTSEPASPPSSRVFPSVAAPFRAQRLCSTCANDLLHQTEEETDEPALLRKATTAVIPAIPQLAPVAETIAAGGHPLPERTRAELEPRFGVGLEQVRIHTGGKAGAAAQALGARAFTVGCDIVFGNGEYAPLTQVGGRLLAHELTHVIQQSGGLATRRTRSAAHRDLAGDAAAAKEPVTATAVSGSGTVLVQRQPVPGLSIPGRDPTSLLGVGWLHLGRSTKALVIDKVIDAALKAVDLFPGKALLGGVWEFVKEGLIGFYVKLKSATEDIKIKAMDKVASIMAGQDQAFTLAYLKGLLKGFFIDGALGIFIAIWDLVKGVGKLWDFLKSIGEAIGRFPEEMEALLKRFEDMGRDLAANFGPAIDEAKKLFTGPQQGSSLIALIVEKAKSLAKQAGEKLSDALLSFFSKPGASAEIGEGVGSITGQVLWEVVFAAVTAGGGAAVTGIKEAAKVFGKLAAKIVAGVLKIVEEIRLVFGKAVEVVRGAIKFVKGKLGELGRKLAELLEKVGEFVGKILGHCHESNISCKFPKAKAAAKERKMRPPRGFEPTAHKPTAMPRVRSPRTREEQMFGVPLLKRLGIETPSKSLRKWAAESLKNDQRDPLYPAHRLKKPGVPDHIIPVDQIRNYEGFAELNRNRQSTILNLKKNMQPLSAEANALKSNRSYRSMVNDPNLGPVDKNFLKEMWRKEAELPEQIRAEIQEQLKEQYRLGESPFD